MKKLNLQGRKFGRLIAIQDVGNNKWNKVIWLCKCDCGVMVKVDSNSLRRRMTQSCGCLQGERTRQTGKNLQHGDSRGKKTRLYQIWRGMKARCYNLNKDNYKYYGAKGIQVCNDWLGNYPAFKFWAILNGYQDNLTIDRINSNDNYKPSNCQWITIGENVSKSKRNGHRR